MRKFTWISVLMFIGLWVAATSVLTRKPERGISRISFASLDANTIDRIEIGGATSAVLKREETVWRLQNGRQADTSLVDSLLRSSAMLISSNMLTESESRFADYQVDAEKGTEITLSGVKTAPIKFVVGKTLDRGAAVRVGHQVFHVEPLYAGAFTKGANDWLDRRLFTNEVGDVTQVAVKLHGTPSFTIANQNGTWSPTQKVSFRFDHQAAHNLVMSLVSSRAGEIIEKDPGDKITHCDTQGDTLTYTVKTGKTANSPQGGLAAAKDQEGLSTRTLLLCGNKDEQNIYAKIVGLPDVYTLANGSAGNLRQGLAGLRDLNLVEPFETDAVTALTLQDGATKTVLRKDKDTKKWTLEAKNTAADFEIDPAKVMERLQAIRYARANGVVTQVTAKKSGLSSSQVFATVKLPDNKYVMLRFGAPAPEFGDMIYVQGNADNAIYYTYSNLRSRVLGSSDSLKSGTAGGPPMGTNTVSSLPPEVRRSLKAKHRKHKS